MTLRHFRIFQSVCVCGSITGAAEALNMGQPAVSLAIKELESFYCTRLFDRMNRRIFITEDGKLLLQYAATVLAQYEESVRVIREGNHSVECRIGVNITIGETKLSKIVSDIEKRDPTIHLKVFIGNLEAIERRLSESSIDFAIIDQPSRMPNYHKKLLYQGRMEVVCSPSYDIPSTITVADLQQQRLFLREKGSASRDIVNAVFQQQGFELQPAVESVSSLALLQLAKSGCGFSILPTEFVQSDLRANRLKSIQVKNAEFRRCYYLIYHKNKYLTKAMHAVMDFILDSRFDEENTLW